MGQSFPSPRLYRFGVFEIEPASGELRRKGLKVKIQDQPFKVLTALLERPGEVVTREELQRVLWPDGTFVDFEHSLASAVGRLREALGDSAAGERYIETIPKRGYRFVAPVEEIAPGAGSSKKLPGFSTQGWLQSRFSKASFCLGLLTVVIIVWLSSRDRPLDLQAPVFVRLTQDSHLQNLSALATDGESIFFCPVRGQVWSLASIPVEGGAPQAIPTGLKSPFLEDISPNGRELLVSDRAQLGGSFPFYSVSLLDGTTAPIPNIEGTCACWSSDGKSIIYTSRFGLRMASRDGMQDRRIADVSMAFWPRASPDGTRIRFSEWSTDLVHCSLWEVGVDGKGLRRLFPGWNESPSECCGHWSADGRSYFFLSGFEDSPVTWVIEEGEGPERQPVRLSFGPTLTYSPVPSRDGRSLFLIGSLEKVEVMRYERASHRFAPFLPGESMAMLDFARDGSAVAFVSHPEGTLYRSNPDLGNKVLLSPKNLPAAMPRWSPDGRRIAFSGKDSGGLWQIYTVSAQGGVPKMVSPSPGLDQADPGWSSDGSRLVFTEGSGFMGYQLRLLDLPSGQLERLEGSEGLRFPRWSPDGRSIAALRALSLDLVVFDLETGTWEELAEGPAWWPSWSGDSRSIYLVRPGSSSCILRVDLRSRQIETITELHEVGYPTSIPGLWVGLAPDDSPLVLRDLSVREIYALQWKGQP